MYKNVRIKVYGLRFTDYSVQGARNFEQEFWTKKFYSVSENSYYHWSNSHTTFYTSLNTKEIKFEEKLSTPTLPLVNPLLPPSPFLPSPL